MKIGIGGLNNNKALAPISVRHLLGLGPVLIGAVVLSGWLFDVPILKSMLPGLTTMKANTAFGLIISGIGILAVPSRNAIRPMREWRTPVFFCFGVIVLLVGVCTLVEYALGWPLGIDELLFADPNTTSPPYPGRMAPPTAFGFAFAGAAILLLGYTATSRSMNTATGRSIVGAAHLLAAAPASIGYLSLASYAYGVESLHSLGAFVIVALHTAVGFLLLALSIWLTQADLGWARAFAGLPVAQRTFRRLLPVCLLLPILAGMIVVGGARAGIYNPLYCSVLFALVAAAALVGMAWRLSSSNAELEHLTGNLSKARDQAEQANQAKSRFLAVITHELRTPLHGILGYAELLSLQNDLTPTQTERLEVMMASGQHLLDMIDAVLDMSQIEADRLKLHPTEVDLAELIRTCLDVVRPAADAKGLVLCPMPLMPLRVMADATRIRQIVINLLGNAIKFTPTGSAEVRMQTTQDGARVRLEVADTGPGIRPGDRDKLFQTFERLNANSVAIEGAGLGLAIAARLVRLMDGEIGYTDNLNGGSVFWFELPIRSVPPGAIKASVTSSASAEVASLRVLVADDEVLNRNIATGFLRNAGHDVVCVGNGAAAVEAVSAEDFDIVLMDVRMPVMNGLEATRHIRALPAPRGAVRVVAVTAQAYAQQIEACRQAGMDGHISKPFKQATLLAALEAPSANPGQPAGKAGSVAVAHATDNEPKCPVFDREVFEEATNCLTTTEVTEQWQVLLQRCQMMLRALHGPERLTRSDALIEDAHRLAGGAGMFGFLRVATAARQYEIAVEAVASRAATDNLIATLEASLPQLLRQPLSDTVSAA